MAANLRPGQWELGDVVFGRYTDYPVEKVDYEGYGVNAQDFQSPLSDENRFGFDTLKPGTLVFTMSSLVNYALPNMVAFTGIPLEELDYSDTWTNLTLLQKEWRADTVRLQWGSLKPLRFCDDFNNTLRVYGRPRKFQYTKRNRNQTYHNIVAEYQLADTIAYGDTEYYVDFVINTPQTITRIYGNASNWVRFVITGPAVHPIIDFGTFQFELDWTIDAGEAVEISSYPWLRRIIDSNNYNLGPYLIATEPYLDKILFEFGSKLISWTASGTNGNSKMRLLWRDGYQVMF